MFLCLLVWMIPRFVMLNYLNCSIMFHFYATILLRCSLVLENTWSHCILMCSTYIFSVQLEQGTVTSLLEENGTIKGVQYKTKDGRELKAHAPLTIVCDGCFSNLRRTLCKPQVKFSSTLGLSFLVWLGYTYTNLLLGMVDPFAYFISQHHEIYVRLTFKCLEFSP